MPLSIQDTILNRIKTRVNDKVFTNKDFRDLGGRAAIDKALSRLVTEGSIVRLGRGLYFLPKVNPRLGLSVSPEPKQIAQAIARRTGSRITASGALAANLLGLSTQVPAKYTFLTDGDPKTIRVGNVAFVFKHAAPKDMCGIGRHSGLVIQALKYMGKAGIDTSMIHRLSRVLSVQEKKQLLRDVSHATDWIVDVVHRIADSEESDQHG